ncbi:MAG: SPOR domain-containing protein [bacterium]|nr:SPOR domain-containing protein [bacterium]MDT8365346.1 SPOR domain-containing protein [bacterium]
MAKRSNQPRELVRLSPLQFSLSISIVVILLGAAALAGYFYGMRQSIRSTGETGISSTGDLPGKAEFKSDAADSQTSVTFYSALKEPRGKVPVVRTPLVKSGKTPDESTPAAPAVSVPPLEDPTIPGKGSVTLQVASYKDQVNARKLLHDLSSEGYAGTIVRIDLDDRGVWFRVRIGPYAEEKSESILKKLRDERKLKGYVVK